MYLFFVVLSILLSIKSRGRSSCTQRTPHNATRHLFEDLEPLDVLIKQLPFSKPITPSLSFLSHCDVWVKIPDLVTIS
ncbi:hypothetical protein QBC43DRAFT_316134 [Cladorrhinum sp. PSN259]|nr:hypothetical protein QBC43DRAFT_316134 [Cladorrhinum sp. PSN259]